MIFATLHPLSIVLFSGLALALIGFGIYSIVSTKTNNKLSKYASFEKQHAVYTVKVDFNKQRISFYTQYGNTDAIEYRMSDFNNKLDKDEQEKWRDWLRDLLRDDENDFDDDKNITLGIHTRFSRDSVVSDTEEEHWYRFAYKSRNGEVLYLHAIEIDISLQQQIASTESLIMIDWDEFVGCVSQYGESAKGALFCLDCNLYSIVSRRYSAVIGEQLLQVLWKMVHSFNSSECTAGRYQDDRFLFYFPKCTNHFNAQHHALDLIEKFTKLISFDIYQFELKPTVGVAFMGQYSTDVPEVISEAASASEVVKERRIKSKYHFYNEELAIKNRTEKEHLDELKQIINGMAFNPIFFPIFSLQNGNEIGYFSEVDFSAYKIKNFAEAYRYATKAKMQVPFIGSAVRSWLDAFLKQPDKKGKRIFIFCDFAILEQLEDLVTNEPEYHRLDIVAIITHYSDLLEAGDKIRDILYRARLCHISLGLVADEDMQTSVISALHYFSWLVLPSRLTKLVGIDQKVKLVISNIVDIMEHFSLNVIAWNISNYSQAEILKSLGVTYMHGSILDSRDVEESNSVRKIAKLIDERE